MPFVPALLALALLGGAIAEARVSVELRKRPTPAMSILNAKGAGFTPCNYTFNPAWIAASEGTNGTTGLLLRVAQCPPEFGGAGDHIMAAFCATDGTCGDLQNIQFPFETSAEDPRVILDKDGWYYLWYYASGTGQSTVYTRRSKTPFDASSWEVVSRAQPWHRNGCAFPSDSPAAGYLVVGESPPLPALSLVKSHDDFKAYTVVNDTLLRPNSASDPTAPEVVVEASTPPVRLSNGDYFHVYSAGTPGWVANGNYTAGFVIFGSDMRVKQRSAEHFLVASLPFEGVDPGKYPVQRYRTTFATSIVPSACDDDIRPQSKKGYVDCYRLWWGAADANVATGTLIVRSED